VVIGTLAQEGSFLIPKSPDDLIGALSKDLDDGVFDGLGSAPIPLGSGTLPSTAGTSQFLVSAASYVVVGSAITQNDITPTEVAPISTAIAKGVSTSPLTPPTAVLAQSFSSGPVSATTVLVTNPDETKETRTYVFMAAGTQGVAVINVTNPNAPSAKAWTYLSATTFSGVPVNGVTVTAGTPNPLPLPCKTAGPPNAHTDPLVLLYSYADKHIALVDAATLATGTPGTDDVNGNLVCFQEDLPLNATSPVHFSGGTAYISGGIFDNMRNAGLFGGAWLATADGYGFFDVTHPTSWGPNGTPPEPLVPVLQAGGANPSVEYLAENLGGDTTTSHLLFAPNYLNAYVPGNWGIQLITQLTTSPESYAMDPTAFKNAFPINVGPDAGAVDRVYQVGIITFEDTNTVGFLNLGAINLNSPMVGGFTPSSSNATAFLQFCKSCGGGYFAISGSAVDGSPNAHQALFMAGYSSDSVVGLLQPPTISPWNGLSDWVFYDLNASSTLRGYRYAGDPHADGVVPILVTTSSGTFIEDYGYLLDGSDVKAVQIDLGCFLNTSKLVTEPCLQRAGSSGDAAHQPALDPGTVGALRSISW
jgi:hypothetical protein